MRTLISFLVFISTAACSSPDWCRSVPLGGTVTIYERIQFTSSVEPVYRGMIGPSTAQHPGLPASYFFDVGPTDQAACCAMQQAGRPLSWCTPEQLDCSDPSMQDLKIYLLTKPYSDLSREPDDAEVCFVVAKDDSIIAILQRYWS